VSDRPSTPIHAPSLSISAGDLIAPRAEVIDHAGTGDLLLESPSIEVRGSVFVDFVTARLDGA
jgi:hypothetical protein